MCILNGVDTWWNVLTGNGSADKAKKETDKQINNIKQPLIEAQELDKKANQYQENDKVLEVPTKVQNTINYSATSTQPTNQQRLVGLNLGG